MKSPPEITKHMVDSKKSSAVLGTWKSKAVWSVCSSVDRFAQFCHNAHRFSRNLGHEATRVLEDQWQKWMRMVIVHVLPVTAALVIIVLNMKGFFIGKQLQGKINQDGTKMLLLQITAKVHELLILASLADVLYSYLLHLLVFGDGAPLGALTAGEEFANISYLWSEDFFAICRAKFSRKVVLVFLVVICTMLGIVVGPSSATAMAPWRDGWVADQIGIPVNVSKQRLWPLILDENTLPKPLCLNGSQVCGTDSVWTSLSANLFSYWGESSYGSVLGMPEAAGVGIGSAHATRTLRVRFRGPLSLYQPEFTVATIQPVSAARIVNGLRMLWFSDHIRKCFQRRRAYCDYEDIKWSIDTMQPTVYVACIPTDLMEDLTFPTMNRVENSASTSRVFTTAPIFANKSGIAAEAVQLDSDFPNVSVGSLIRINRDNSSVVYACSIDAQWSKSAVVTTFSGSPYIVDGSAPDFFIPTAEGSTYEGQRVQIEASWANMVLSSIDATTNLTVLDSLYASGDIPDPSRAGEKIESVLSVLIADSMARVESQAELDLGDTNADLATLQWSEIRDLHTVSTSAQTLAFQTVVTGYGYGILNGGNVAVGPLLSVLVLLLYCSIIVTHFGVKLVQQKDTVETWRSMIELLVLALQTSLEPSQMKVVDQNSITGGAILRKNVKLVQEGKRAGMVFVDSLDRNLGYQRLSQSHGI